MTCCKKCYYRNKNSKYTNENCVFFDQSVEILDWVQLCLRRCFEDVASAQQYFQSQYFYLPTPGQPAEVGWLVISLYSSPWGSDIVNGASSVDGTRILAHLTVEDWPSWVPGGWQWIGWTLFIRCCQCSTTLYICIGPEGVTQISSNIRYVPVPLSLWDGDGSALPSSSLWQVLALLQSRHSCGVPMHLPPTAAGKHEPLERPDLWRGGPDHL